jgi:hypothetical protein
MEEKTLKHLERAAQLLVEKLERYPEFLDDLRYAKWLAEEKLRQNNPQSSN